MALYAAGSDSCASALFFSVIRTLAFFTRSRISLLRRKLNTRLFSDARCAFFAEDVFATRQIVTQRRRVCKDTRASAARAVSFTLMIGYIEGEVVHAEAGSAVIKTESGIGYKVFSTPDTISTLKNTVRVSLWTHLAVRENAHDLYGFETRDELHFFELLLGVSGIGPRSALGILSIASIENLRSAIASNKPSYLTKVSGIGKKTAEKIVLELGDKIGTMADGGAEALRGDEETLEALVAMGYTITEARDALKKVPSEEKDSSARLKAVLQTIGK